MTSPKPLRVMVVGPCQVGKSTLINVLIRSRRAKTGDGMKPCSQRCREFRSPCKRLVFVDAPGINAEDDHDLVVEEGFERCDAAVFVATGIRQLSQAELRLGGLIARKRIPTVLVVNCWPNGWDMNGDPERLRGDVGGTIQGQFSNLGGKVIRCEKLNIEWAAAARGILPKTRAEKLIYEFGGGSAESRDELELRSRVQELEKLLMPRAAEALEQGSLEYSVLLSKFFNGWR